MSNPKKQKALIWFLFIGVILGGYLIKYPCFARSWGSTLYCYNDIQALYGIRGLSEKKIPYFEVLPYEYPPLIAFQMYLTSLVVNNNSDFFIVNWVVNIFCLGLALFLLLELVADVKRARYFCLSSPLLLYASMNWDASSVLLLTAVIYSYKKERWFWVGGFASLSLGGKLFPILCLIPIFIQQFKNRQVIKKLVLGTLWGGSVIYLPLVFISLWKEGNLNPLLSILLFHAKRLPEYDTFWHWTGGIFGFSPVSDEYRVFVERSSLFLFLIGSGVLLLQTKSSVWGKSGALILLLLLVSKIYSPQYALWVLPFLVLNPAPLKAIGAFYLADVWAFVSRFNWYPLMGKSEEFFWKNQLMWAVFLRTAVFLFLLYYWALRSNKTALKRDVST